MTKADKLLSKLKSKPVPMNFTWDNLCTLLQQNGFEQVPNKKTSGSARRFIHVPTQLVFTTHEPHPQKELKAYQIQDVLDALQRVGVIENE